jgi:ubiquinone/menaquinone biosynthesis C-methylase UbiE
MLKINDADTILDAGCGAGNLVPYVLENKKPNAKLHCMDISKEMLLLLCKRVE